MGRSFRVARIAGIDVSMHFTFLLMLPLAAMLFGGSGPLGMVFGLVMVLLLFGSVLLHEFGHAFTAKALGIPVREIQLLPIGGVAVLGRPVVNPAHELLIAIMGPVVNVLIVIALAFVAIASGMAARLSPEMALTAIGTPSFDGAVLWLVQANVLLALFNMLPAFPLDGGRVARALLAFVMPFRRATLIAGVVGQALAVLLAVWGFTSGNLLLVATALFIFFAARQEVAASEVTGVLGELRVADALTGAPAVVEVGQRIRDAAAAMQATGQSAAVVLQGERPLGVVLLPEAQAAIAAGKGEVWVTMAMRRQYVAVQATDSLDDARITMAEQNTPVVAVFDGDQFRGLLTIDAIAAAFRSGAAGGRPPQGPPPRPEATPSG